MFSRILYQDDEKILALNWLGFGALQVVFRNGKTRQAHPFQKQVILSIITHFENNGQPLSPNNERCTHMMREMCELVLSGPTSLQWQVIMRSDLREVAKSYSDY